MANKPTCRHTEQPIFSPEASTLFVVVIFIFGSMLTESPESPLVPSVAKMSGTSSAVLSTALICSNNSQKWHITFQCPVSLEHPKFSSRSKVTWVCTALNITGPTSSRTSLPLKRLEMMSICKKQVITWTNTIIPTDRQEINDWQFHETSIDLHSK